MNCYNHTDQPAVATCIDCGKGLCSECSNKYTILVCDSCNLNRLYIEKSSMLRRWGISIVIAILFTFFNSQSCPWPKNSLLYLIAIPTMIISVFVVSMGIQYGWRLLNIITPRMFLFLPLVGWLIYFGVRLSIASFVGIIIAPMMLFQDVKRYKEVKKTIEYIKG